MPRAPLPVPGVPTQAEAVQGPDNLYGDGLGRAVVGFAAVVSYSHIYDLAQAHGQAGTAARLLPLPVDGLIVAATLVMLHEAATSGIRPCWRG